MAHEPVAPRPCGRAPGLATQESTSCLRPSQASSGSCREAAESGGIVAEDLAAIGGSDPAPLALVHPGECAGTRGEQ